MVVKGKAASRRNRAKNYSAWLFGPGNGSDEWLPRVTCLSMEVHKQAIPEGWVDSVFEPAMKSHGFKWMLESGELAVWCHSERYTGNMPAAVNP